MIITVSGWRGNVHHPDEWPLILPSAMGAYEVGKFFLRFGDCPTGTDISIWQEGLRAHHEYYRYKASWHAHGRAAGPLRNRAMLRGDDPLDPTAGMRADLLLAFPEPGPRKPGSGTWDCVDAAWDLGIETWLLRAGI